MSELVDDLNELREELDVLQQQAEETSRRLSPVQGADETASVSVKLSETGSFQSATVNPGWRSRISAEELGSAVLMALANAAGKRMEQYAEVQSDVEETESFTARPAGLDPRVEQLSKNLQAQSGERADASLAQTMDLLNEMLAGLDRAEALVDAHGTQEYVGRSGKGRVTATVTGESSVTAVSINPKWLATAHEVNLSREITQAIRAALDQAAASGLASIMDATGLAAYQSLLGNNTTPKPGR
ncbi:YbaB/EbfC family nucleoid-associated protein [Nocardioides speluncae]|uniref:YbaB/EbfC family nucleoid-associated protein n=1 Tax=Nocardioides speluncae TaxID=2670337 RepID=UPI000D6865D8|nr:YbaB/EbfC family nucleoid-associated protein [Nocardioides speluncae]